MPRDVRTYVLDILDSCDAVASAIEGVDFESYVINRVLRSAIEREFITIGEAMRVLRGLAPEVFARITQAHRIVDFRNQLTHEYSSTSDAIVWTIAVREAPMLRVECASSRLWMGRPQTNNGNTWRLLLRLHDHGERRQWPGDEHAGIQRLEPGAVGDRGTGDGMGDPQEGRDGVGRSLQHDDMAGTASQMAVPVAW